MKRISIEEAEKRGYEVHDGKHSRSPSLPVAIEHKAGLIHPCYTPLEWQLLEALKGLFSKYETTTYDDMRKFLDNHDLWNRAEQAIASAEEDI